MANAGVTASKLGTDLTDIDDEDEEEESSDEEDLHSSRGILTRFLSFFSSLASSMRLKRDSSADSIGLQRQLSDDSDSSGRRLDLAELRRSRLQHPGKISMFDTASERKSRKDEEDAQSNAEKARELFDLPETEKIVTG